MSSQYIFTKSDLLEIAMRFHAQTRHQINPEGYHIRSSDIIENAEIFGKYLNGSQPQAQPESSASTPAADPQMTPCPECGVVRQAP